MLSCRCVLPRLVAELRGALDACDERQRQLERSLRVARRLLRAWYAGPEATGCAPPRALRAGPLTHFRVARYQYFTFPPFLASSDAGRLGRCPRLGDPWCLLGLGPASGTCHGCSVSSQGTRADPGSGANPRARN